MVKKSLFVGVFALMLVSGSVNAYTDIDGHWAQKEITNLSLNGIVSGYDDNSFKPDKNMTRAELTTVINRLLGNSIENTKYVPDINAKDWFYSEIRKGIESGVIKGDANGYVRPNDLVTREEAIVMIQRAIVPITSNAIMNNYSDFNEISEWSKRAITTFISENYIKGYEDNTIKPKNYITRAVGAFEKANADYFYVETKPGDVILVCSDGLTNMLSDEEILTIVYQEDDLEFTCNKLVQAANEKGGYDNISVILAKNMEDGKENPIL